MKNRIFLTLLSALLVAAGSADRTAAQNLIPKPVSVVHGDGFVTLAPYRTVEVTDGALAPLADYLAEWLPAGRVRLSLDGPQGVPSGGYRLEVGHEGISIAGVDYSGVWNGIQTLLQLLPAEIYSRGVRPESLTLPAVTVEDWPAMEYRGVMLDVARTFVPVEQVMRLVDNISRHKINRLHWHLADDEGWRVEIKSWPRLTEIGAWRGPDTPVWAVYGAWDRRYGGFYTQDEIRRVVDYAAVRGVEIIPEIDLPGHSRAAARAYPEILCGYTPSLTSGAGYDTRNVFCVAREENYAMLDDIIGEVAALFPSSTLHLGGDEVETAQWRQCPHCKALMAERGITDAARLQDIFMARVIDIAARHGKQAGVWNEAAAGANIPLSTTVWGWETPAAARRVAADGYPTVVCPGEYFYFDMRQSPTDIGHIWAGIVTLEKVYSFSPEALGFSEAEAANVRGVEATFFSELLLENGPGLLDYQLFPRVCALAEVAWTPAAGRSWDDFDGRLRQRGAEGAPSHFDRLAAMGIAYRAAPPVSPTQAPLKKPAATFTSSMTGIAREPFSRVADYSGAARTDAACTEGDTFQWTFDQPVAASRIDVKTGYDHLQRGGVPVGRVEVSYDGLAWETAARMHDLKATVTLDPARPIRALRIVSETHGNGETFTIIQPLKIR